MKKTLYRCRECGYLSPRWLGRCPHCGGWGTFELVSDYADAPKLEPRMRPQPLAEIELHDHGRLATGIDEFDRILGGGVIKGSVVLIGGEPGVGKSTLMLQVADRLAGSGPVLYVSGEESPAQVRLRAERLRLSALERLLIFSEQHLELIADEARKLLPRALVVDSIQTVFPFGEKAGEPGGARQVGTATFELSQLARELEVPVFLIGHITKSGEFAGPKAIEHLVDVVLYLERGGESSFRLLRAVKNRYGSCEEVGVFQMIEEGLQEVANPSELFTARSAEPISGSVIVPSLEGTRPILVEIQALVAGRYGGGYPQRRSTGLDYNRVVLLLAVIEKRLGIQIGGEDVYLSTAGGLMIRETAADLGAAAAVVSSFKDRPIDRGTVVVGEVSLAGEVRPVRRLKERLSEAGNLGYRRAVIPPSAGLEGLDLELCPAKDVEEAMEVLLS